MGVELKLPPGIHVFADQRLFLRTVENILRNAVQHAKSNFVLELTEDGDQVWVTVHDDGPGIPVAMREKVLNPFFRVEAERNHKAGGVGLGLAIVGRITQQHGGRVVVAGLAGRCAGHDGVVESHPSKTDSAQHFATNHPRFLQATWVRWALNPWTPAVHGKEPRSCHPF